MTQWGFFCKSILALILLLCACGATTVAAADDAAALRYAFEEGKTYVYDLSIHIEMPEAQQTITGLSKYEVKSVDKATGQITLTHSADLASAWRVTAQGDGAAMRMMRGPIASPFTFANYNAPCQIVIDPHGKIVRYERKSQLPYLMGNLWALTLEPLPSAGEKTWQSKRDLEIAQQDTNGWFPRPMMNRPVNWSAKETIDYSIGDATAEAPVITRTYAMVTAEQADDEPVFSQKGKGTITFDAKAGVIQSVEEKYTLRVNDPGVTLKIPITITAKRMSPADAEKKIADRRAAAEEAQRNMEESQKPKVIQSSELDPLLAAIKSGDRARQFQALDRLAKAIPIEARRDEVAAVLVDQLSKGDHFTVTKAEKALKLWGNDSSEPALIKLLEDHDVFIRNGAIEALAPRKTELVAEAIAKHLIELNARQQTKQALQAMGPVAEKPVLPLLKDREWTVRMNACEILGTVGTSQSVDALKAAVSDENGLVRMKAQEALNAIEGRTSK